MLGGEEELEAGGAPQPPPPPAAVAAASDSSEQSSGQRRQRRRRSPSPEQVPYPTAASYAYHHLLRHTVEDSGAAKERLLGALATSRASRAARAVSRKGQRELQELFRVAFGQPTHSNNNTWIRKKLLEVLEVQVDKYLESAGSGRRKRRRRRGPAAAAAVAPAPVPTAPSASSAATADTAGGESADKEGAGSSEGEGAPSAQPSSSLPPAQSSRRPELPAGPPLPTPAPPRPTATYSGPAAPALGLQVSEPLGAQLGGQLGASGSSSAAALQAVGAAVGAAAAQLAGSGQLTQQLEAGGAEALPPRPPALTRSSPGLGAFPAGGASGLTAAPYGLSPFVVPDSASGWATQQQQQQLAAPQHPVPVASMAALGRLLSQSPELAGQLLAASRSAELWRPEGRPPTLLENPSSRSSATMALPSLSPGLALPPLPSAGAPLGSQAGLPLNNSPYTSLESMASQMRSVASSAQLASGPFPSGGAGAAGGAAGEPAAPAQQEQRLGKFDCLASVAEYLLGSEGGHEDAGAAGGSAMAAGQHQQQQQLQQHDVQGGGLLAQPFVQHAPGVSHPDMQHYWRQHLADALAAALLQQQAQQAQQQQQQQLLPQAEWPGLLAAAGGSGDWPTVAAALAALEQQRQQQAAAAAQQQQQQQQQLAVAASRILEHLAANGPSKEARLPGLISALRGLLGGLLGQQPPSEPGPGR